MQEKKAGKMVYTVVNVKTDCMKPDCPMSIMHRGRRGAKDDGYKDKNSDDAAKGRAGDGK